MPSNEVDLLGLDEHLREVNEEDPRTWSGDGAYLVSDTSPAVWRQIDGVFNALNLQYTEEEGWHWIRHGGPAEEPPEPNEPEWRIWLDECGDDPELPF